MGRVFQASQREESYEETIRQLTDNLKAVSNEAGSDLPGPGLPALV